MLDLSECVLMDSTFLGVLAGFGLKLSGGNGDQAGMAIELFNPSPRITELLETLGCPPSLQHQPGRLHSPGSKPAH